MERFSRFRRYKKATAAAAGGAPLTDPEERIPSGIISSAGTPAPPQETPFSAPTPPPRPATSAGTITTAPSSIPTPLPTSTPTSIPTSTSIPPSRIPQVPKVPKVPSIQANSTRPTTSSHAPSTSYTANAPPLPTATTTSDLQSQSQTTTPSTLPTTQQKMRGAMRTSRSPFRNLLRSSTKRSRGSPPSTPPTGAPTTAVVTTNTVAMPASPTAGLNVQMQSISFPAGTSPSPSKRTGGASISTIGTEERRSMQSMQSVASYKPTMPSFLNTMPREMEAKFHELLWLERSRISSSVAQPTGRWARVHSAHARSLDRYINIQPWERNRVKLQVPVGHMQYINASPITLNTKNNTGEKRPDRFIAMQGPKQNSVDHVWRMVYEQLRSPAVIVMLTETHEGMQEKCFPYFPRDPDDEPMQINAHDEFGDGFRATVRCEAIEETAYGDAIELRRIVMRVHRRAAAAATTKSDEGPSSQSENERRSEDDTEMGGASLRPASSSTGASGASGGAKIAEEDAGNTEAAADIDMTDFEDERVIYHFLYKRWPDFGVPVLDDVDSFLGLMRLSAEKNADHDNARIVHCSAGVGRSGTFIALEHLQRELEAGVFESCENETEDIVFSTVNQLREQRRMMVQAESQYMFIYRVLRKLWEDKYGVAAAAAKEVVDGSDSTSETSSYASEPAAKRLEVDPHPERRY